MVPQIMGTGHKRAWRGQWMGASPFILSMVLCGGAAQAQSVAPQTLPQGGSVVAGSATIAKTAPAALAVTTGSQRTAIEWNSFSIGSIAWKVREAAALKGPASGWLWCANS